MPEPRWIDALDLTFADEVPEELRLVRALNGLSHALHLTLGGAASQNGYSELLVSTSSALIVAERRRLKAIIKYPAMGISLSKRADYSADGSLVFATAAVANALSALEDQATGLAVAHLRNAEAELRVRWKGLG